MSYSVQLQQAAAQYLSDVNASGTSKQQLAQDANKFQNLYNNSSEHDKSEFSNLNSDIANAETSLGTGGGENVYAFGKNVSNGGDGTYSQQNTSSKISSDLSNVNNQNTFAYDTGSGLPSAFSGSRGTYASEQAGAADAERYMTSHGGTQDAQNINNLGTLASSSNDIGTSQQYYSQMTNIVEKDMKNGTLDQSHGQEMLNAIAYNQQQHFNGDSM